MVLDPQQRFVAMRITRCSPGEFGGNDQFGTPGMNSHSFSLASPATGADHVELADHPTTALSCPFPLDQQQTGFS